MPLNSLAQQDPDVAQLTGVVDQGLDSLSRRSVFAEAELSMPLLPKVEVASLCAIFEQSCKGGTSLLARNDADFTPPPLSPGAPARIG